MNVPVWASMQNLDVLEQIDRMIPDLVSEKDFEEVRRKKLRRRRGYRSSRVDTGFSFWRAVGSLLVIVATIALIPGPSDYAAAVAGFAAGASIGAAMGGGLVTVLAGVAGAVVFVVSINLVALGLLALGTYLIAQG